MPNFDVLGLIAGLPGLIIAIVIHEYAHARIAVAMGDYTPQLTGRLSLNPLSHIDPVGFFMLIFIRFGWAKPVIINPHNFKNWKMGSLLVALAGPAANLLIAFFTVFVIGLLLRFHIHLTTGMQLVLYLIVIYNINFSIFNMLPIPPLDGSKVLMTFLPDSLAVKLSSLEQYSVIIFLIMAATPIVSIILVPLQRFIFVIFNVILSFIF